MKTIFSISNLRKNAGGKYAPMNRRNLDNMFSFNGLEGFFHQPTIESSAAAIGLIAIDNCPLRIRLRTAH
ncbi:MAG TPA: hypothetical protein VFG29_04335 [Syntrophales bacterium]|nr:hypothetical protein [Syntrophales bacterium]